MQRVWRALVRDPRRAVTQHLPAILDEGKYCAGVDGPIDGRVRAAARAGSRRRAWPPGADTPEPPVLSPPCTPPLSSPCSPRRRSPPRPLPARAVIAASQGASFREREAACGAMADALAGGRGLREVGPHLERLWRACLRAIDDVKDSVREAGLLTLKA